MPGAPEIEPEIGPALRAHDHAGCVMAQIAAVEARCAEAGLRLTPVRRRVLEILLARHRAMGACDVLAVLKAEGRRARPPVACRALDFLVADGFAYRIERLNGYLACGAAGEDHAPAFLICRGCDAVAEARVDEGAGRLDRAAAGFRIEDTVLEATGLCAACAAA